VSMDPNLVVEAVRTDPALAAAVIQALREGGADPTWLQRLFDPHTVAGLKSFGFKVSLLLLLYQALLWTPLQVAFMPAFDETRVILKRVRDGVTISEGEGLVVVANALFRGLLVLAVAHVSRIV